MKPRKSLSRLEAEEISIAALSFLASEPERMERFLSLTGLSASTIREAAASSGFFLSVLDYVASDEKLLLSFATETRTRPELVEEARYLLHS